ncbi:hypothetical protein [Actinomadura terrae]|uniref:hypothetical protein n=1 Tax=Actinomadura terrae TaxID=604353 RepID=UPI001FA73FD4|nr:hypothetical protein [Actinomadura terrae]
MRWIDPKNWEPAFPAAFITGHLDRLAQECVRQGWQVAPQYAETYPLLRIFDPAAPHIGESATLVPGSATGVWKYRSSTGEDLAPHDAPARAAAKITRILTPYITAALAPRTEQPQAHDTPPPDHEPTTISELQERYAGVICWWGISTSEWWALIPRGPQWKIVSAPDTNSLIQAVIKACAGR